MEDQSACTGEDLLDVFKALNINLLNVNPNTIRAWFDTDDKNMKSLLEWMCTSLSAKNYVSPLEYDEFSKLENPLKDDKYETEVERIETEHPSIFSIEDTELDIELLEYELEHLDDEEMLLDQALAINRSMQENLSNELNEKSTLEIKTATKLKVTKNKTDELAKNLDAINININSQLVKYGQCINDFMYGTQQTLMLTIEDSCQEKVELLSNSIMPILIRPSDETEDSSMFMESTLWISENSRRDMQHDSVKQRLIQSKLNYIVSKTSLETTSKLFDYLMSVKFESLMLLEPMEEIENKIYLKNGRERVMYSMLENIIVDTTGRQVSNSKLRYLQAALANFQSQLKTITELEDLSVLLLAHYHILLIMCSSQTDDIDFSVQFFKKIFYLSNDLQNCENRIMLCFRRK
ncbi:unnamed protein product [Acanthoscelides obtectus]|uniref:HAUS augmin-like complex subunit 3 N-terminal domain-containing protein n=1 Tax=Acanthoscelides obtectus TaxID=200917 RepID=A0A9P0LJS9_ACAOB|nr:unnamed protein product [Acanthoscelides obtectus]CAK1634972.1 hypothetical protein AOBTE_LOCUS8982 [Acanthoscelides obtectus]